MTIAEEILSAVDVLVNQEQKPIFTRVEIREKVGVSPEKWSASYNPVFQSMRSDQPGGAPQVRASFRNVFAQVERGRHRLTNYGTQLVNTLDPQQSVRRIKYERDKRDRMWQELNTRGGPSGVEPRTLRELGIYRGQQGIWVNSRQTSAISPLYPAVTVGLLDTGRKYDEDLWDDGALYHYPVTHRPPNRDLNEVLATKACRELKIPLFFVSHHQGDHTLRDVKLGWVEDWDNDAQTFLIRFGEIPPEIVTDIELEDTEFRLTTKRRTRRRVGRRQDDRGDFRFKVLKRYGSICAVCDLRIKELLDAAHLRPREDDGTDDPRNGLPLCANHHRALDYRLIAIHPETLEIHTAPGRPEFGLLRTGRRSIRHMEYRPHVTALKWVWDEFAPS